MKMWIMLFPYQWGKLQSLLISLMVAPIFGFPCMIKVRLGRGKMDDPELSVIIGWLESKAEPTQGDVSLQSPAVKHYSLMRDQLVFKDGVMFYRWEDCLKCQFLLIVPDSLQAEVIHMNHDSRDSGHLGHFIGFEWIAVCTIMWKHAQNATRIKA